MTDLTSAISAPRASEWDRCAPWLAAALKHDGGHFSIEDVRQSVEAGRAQFWPGLNAAMVTEFWNFPKVRALNIWLAAGDDIAELGQMLPVVEAWAMTQGCGQTMIYGRRGWWKYLKVRGYSEKWTAFVKDLTWPVAGSC